MLAQMEKREVLVLWGIRDQILQFVGMLETMGIQGARGQRDHRGVKGFKDCQAYLETQD